MRCMLAVGLAGFVNVASADKIADENANEVVHDRFTILRKDAFDRLILCIHQQVEPVFHNFRGARNVRPVRLDHVNAIRGRILNRCELAIKNYRNLYPNESKERVLKLIEEEMDHAIEDTERIDSPGHV